MLNLTPHAITVVKADGTRITFPPSGKVARVETREDFIRTCPETGVEVIARELGEPVGLPENGEPCLVSAMVLSACTRPWEQKNVYAPDTGPTAIRENGQIVAVTRLVTCW